MPTIKDQVEDYLATFSYAQTIGGRQSGKGGELFVPDAEQRRAVAAARNARRGRPHAGAKRRESIRVGLLIDSELSSKLDELVYRTGRTKRDLIEEGIVELLRKYRND